MIPTDFTDAEFPADPYPGTRPPGSFVHVDRSGHMLKPDSRMPSEWRVSESGPDLDIWLSEHDLAPMADRLPVLAYGSNANPSKITWLREALGLESPALVFRAECHGIAAVWSAGLRARDDQRPAVLAGMPRITETHTVWYVTPDQRRVLDICEGRGERYRLSWVNASIALENGRKLHQVLAYTARPEVIGQNVPTHLNRSPLLVEGQFVRCAMLQQDEARNLTGVPADSDGLNAAEVFFEPEVS